MLLTLLLAACSVPDGAGLVPGGALPEADTSVPDEVEASFDASVRADLRLKRWRQLSLDLQGALELAADDVCRETDRFDCTTLHVVPLGGVSSDNGLYSPQAQQSVTTGLAMERVVLQACLRRLELDREADEPVVFGHIDLDSDALDSEAAEAQTTELWRRLLARDPSPEELADAEALHGAIVESGGDTASWAAMLCLAVGTSTEALTY